MQDRRSSRLSQLGSGPHKTDPEFYIVDKKFAFGRNHQTSDIRPLKSVLVRRVVYSKIDDDRPCLFDNVLEVVFYHVSEAAYHTAANDQLR